MSETILQPLIPPPGQFRESDSGMQTASVDTTPLSPLSTFGNTNIASLNVEAKRSAEGLKLHQDATGVLDAIQKETARSSNFGAHALATLAALNGNFGPAIALQEQKRKSKSIEQLTPALSKANELANSGRLQESTEFLQKVSANIADRAPEAQKVLQAAIEKISTKQYQFEQFKAYTKIMDENTPKNHPNRSIVNSFKIAADSNMPFTIDILKEIMANARPNVTVQDGVAQITSPVTGQTLSQPTEKFFDKKDLGGTVGLRLSSATGLLENQIVNSLQTGEPVTNSQGQVFTSQELQQLTTKAQGLELQKVLSAAVPMDPALASGLRAIGKTPEQIALGDLSKADIDAAETHNAQRARELSIYQRQAGLEVPAPQADKPAIAFNRETGQADPFMTISDAQRNRDKMALVEPEKFNKEIQPLYKLQNKLALLQELLPELPDINSPLARTSSWIAKKLNNIFGFDEKLIEQQTLQSALSTFIEDYANAKGISAQRIADMKAPLTSEKASKEGATVVLNQLNNLIKTDLDQYRTQPAQSALGPSTSSYSGFMQAIKGTEGSAVGAISPKGATGQFQVMPQTAAQYLTKLGKKPTDLKDEKVNADVAALHMADLEKLYPNRPDLAAAAYFSGTGNVDAKRGIIIDPTKSDGNLTTQQYVDRVMKRMKDQQAASVVAAKLPKRDEPLAIDW